MATETNFSNRVFDTRIDANGLDDTTHENKKNQMRLRLVVLLAICKELTPTDLNTHDNRGGTIDFLKSFLNSYYNIADAWDKIQITKQPNGSDWDGDHNEDNKRVAVLFNTVNAVTDLNDVNSQFVPAQMQDNKLIEYLVNHPDDPSTESTDVTSRNDYLKNTLVKISLDKLINNLKDAGNLVPDAAKSMKGGGRKSSTLGSSSGASGERRRGQSSYSSATETASAKVKTSRPSSSPSHSPSPSARPSKSASVTTLTSAKTSKKNAQAKSRSQVQTRAQTQAQTQSQAQRAQARPNSGSGLSSSASSSRTMREAEKKNGGGGKRSSRVASPSSHSSPKSTRNTSSRRT